MSSSNCPEPGKCYILPLACEQSSDTKIVNIIPTCKWISCKRRSMHAASLPHLEGIPNADPHLHSKEQNCRAHSDVSRRYRGKGLANHVCSGDNTVVQPGKYPFAVLFTSGGKWRQLDKRCGVAFLAIKLFYYQRPRHCI